MDFIIGLAHWCEIHGPSLILCTQVIPPQCGSCFPGSGGNKTQLTRSGSEPTLGSTSTSGNTTTSGTTATTAGAPPTTTTTPVAGITPPPTSHGVSTAPLRPTSNRSASTPRLSSPTETPPASPRSPTIVPSAPEQCRNCTMTLPPQFEGNSTTGRRPLRTTETLLVNSGGDPDRPPSSPVGGSAPAFPSVSEMGGMYEELMTHTHTISYLSSRSPSNPARYAAVRQACIRTLSCELAPSQTSPILFGDPQIGYTIAVVFKVSDNKSRGGLRTYALLAMSMNQKALVQQWGVISGVFMNLVLDIQWGVGERIAREKEAEEAALRSSAAGTGVGAGTTGNFGVGAFGAGSLGSRGPESFLRRRNPGDGAEKRSLADLVGKDRFFVDLHSTFVRLLAGLARVYGFGEAEAEEEGSGAETGAIGLQTGALATGVMTQAMNTEARKAEAAVKEAVGAEKAADAKLSQHMQAINLGQPARAINTQSTSTVTTRKADASAPATATATPAPTPKKTPTRSMTAPAPLPGPIPTPTPTPARVTATHVITHSTAAPAPGAVPKQPPVSAPTIAASAAPTASPAITQPPTITQNNPMSLPPVTAAAIVAAKPSTAKRTDSEATITPASSRAAAATTVSTPVTSPTVATSTLATAPPATTTAPTSTTVPQKSPGTIPLPTTTSTTQPPSPGPISPNFTTTRHTGVVGY
ncbi:vesicle coat protein [Pyronema domesticum]|nr:vesicle coat protein [Pyronema domesticum]